MGVHVHMPHLDSPLWRLLPLAARSRRAVQHFEKMDPSRIIARHHVSSVRAEGAALESPTSKTREPAPFGPPASQVPQLQSVNVRGRERQVPIRAKRTGAHPVARDRERTYLLPTSHL